MSSKEKARDITLGVIRIPRQYNGPKGVKRSKDDGPVYTKNIFMGMTH